MDGARLIIILLLLEVESGEASDANDITSLGCWGESESDRAISGDFGKLDKASCYETTKSLGYSVFAINNGSNCHTSPSAWTTYKKYGPLECNNSRANEVYQIKKDPSENTGTPTVNGDKKSGKNKEEDLNWHTLSYVCFGIYVVLVIVNLGHTLKQPRESGTLIFNHAKAVFRTICFVLAGYMALTQAIRYLDNKDASSIHYKTFNETPLDIYPTFTICLTSAGYPLHHYVRKEVEKQTGITVVQFDQLLKGNDKDISQEQVSKILAMKYSPFQLNFESFIHAMGLEKQYDHKEEQDGESKFFQSHKDPDTVCFSLKSTNDIGVFRKRDWVSLNWEVLEESKVLMQAYLHYPNRLTREIGRPNFELDIDHLEADHSKTTLQLNRLSMLRKRPDAQEPCDKNLENDDEQFRTNVMRKVGCIPMYWESFASSNDSFRPCTSAMEMKKIYEAIQNKENIFAEYDQPCNYMEVSLGASQHDSSYGNVILLELQYMRQLYQEIDNIRDFGLDSFWSSVGGFVGIFLGYSLLLLPNVMENILQWLQEKTENGKKNRKFSKKGKKRNRKITC